MKAGTENLIPFGGQVHYYPDVFTAGECSHYSTHLFNSIQWRQEPIILFGRKIMQPRLTAWYGDVGKPYRYSGITMEPKEWTEELIEIKARAELLAGAAFSSALLNQYRDGHDSMGWHRDNEGMLGPAPVIASVSFGAPRVFQLRNYLNKKLVSSVELNPGSILIMAGSSQKEWEHRLPKATKIGLPRINITFRKIV